MTRRALAIVRRELGPACVYAFFVVPLGALTLFCLLGVPILAHGLAQLASVLVRGARREHSRVYEPEPPVGWAGALALCVIAALLGTTLVASGAAGAVLGEDHAIAQTITALVAAAMAGAALAPFALAPVIAAGGEGGLVRPIGRSVELATRVGARRLAVLGAAGGVLVGGGFVGCSVAVVLSESPVVIVAAVLAPLAGLVFVLALLADAYVRLSLAEAEDRAAPPAEPAHAMTPTEATPPAIERAPRAAGIGLRTLALVLAPLLVLPVAAAAVAALTPTPMQRLEDADDHGGAWPSHASFGSVRARIVPGGVSIEAPDGGGTGFVRARFYPYSLAVDEGVELGGPPGSFAVMARAAAEGAPVAAYTLVNADGVRLDDSLEDRVLGRLGIVGGAALALAVLLLLLLAGRLGVSLGEARTLDAPDLTAAGEGVRRALEGELAMSGAAIIRSRGAIRVEGDAWIVADGLRIRLPPRPVPTLGEGEPQDGRPVVLISRFRKALTANLREAGPAWPDDGLLVLGTLAEAREALARRATTAAAWIALPLAACTFTATAVLLALL